MNKRNGVVNTINVAVGVLIAMLAMPSEFLNGLWRGWHGVANMRRWVVPLVATRNAESRVKQRVARSAFVGHLRMCTSIILTHAVWPIVSSLWNVISAQRAFWTLPVVTGLKHMIALPDL